jgi:hypothetical protein
MFVSFFGMHSSVESAASCRYRNRRERRGQLDEGIGDTLVLVFVLREKYAVARIGGGWPPSPFHRARGAPRSVEGRKTGWATRNSVGEFKVCSVFADNAGVPIPATGLQR